MNRKALVIAITLLALSLPVFAQKTPTSMVASYESIADTILAVRRVEGDFVRAILDGHRHNAKRLMKSGDYEKAAAEIALFANEGDNAVGGVRKRLLEGGHHYNAEGEEKGVFEPGFVIVTREAKQRALEASAALRAAETEEGREAAWKSFAAVAEELLSSD